MSNDQKSAVRNIRVSLTKAQLQSEIGAELISLCQTVTDDGSLSDAEVDALKTWLAEHRTSDLPAIAFLISTVERILEDGVVTPTERKELHKALERVLPPEIRADSVDKRREIEKQERERDRAIDSINFMVAGCRFENRPSIIGGLVNDYDPAFLVRDRNNHHSKYAIEVRLKTGHMVGYVPNDFAKSVAPLLDRGCLHRAYFTKVLTGGRSPIPVVQAYFYNPDAQTEGAVAEGSVLTTPQRIAASGCAPILLMGIAIGAGTIWSRYFL